MKLHKTPMLVLIVPLLIVCVFISCKTSRVTDDIYIEILKYGKSNLGKPVTYSEIKDHLDSLDVEYDEFAMWQLVRSVFIDHDYPNGNQSPIPTHGGRFYLEARGYFDLLGYIELQEARESSKSAMFFASFALLLSLASFVIGIYFKVKERNISG